MTLKEALNVTEITRRVRISKVTPDDDGAYSVSNEEVTPKPLLFPDVALSYLKNKKPELLEAQIIMLSYQFWKDGKPYLEFLIQ